MAKVCLSKIMLTAAAALTASTMHSLHKQLISLYQSASHWRHHAYREAPLPLEAPPVLKIQNHVRLKIHRCAAIRKNFVQAFVFNVPMQRYCNVTLLT